VPDKASVASTAPLPNMLFAIPLVIAPILTCS